MSKRRKRPYKPRVQVAEKQSAADGFVNSLAYLGEASELNRANDYERHPLSHNYELLTVLYRENWIAARIVDTPCEDMTRSWYSVASEIEQDKLDELAKLEAKHSVKQEIANAIRWARLYGGAAAVMVIKGQEDMLDQPLDFDMIQPGCFRGLIVVDKMRGIYPSLELEEDMDDPEFGYPKYYDVMLDEETGSTIKIHHSRLLIFRGRMLPIDEEISEDYWGAPELEHVYEELQKRNATSANVAQLVFQANVAALKMGDYGEVLGMGTERQKQQVYQTIYEMNRLRTSFGLALMSQEDSYEQHPYSFAGVAEVYETFMMDMAGAAEIPATKLFGRAPQGMNATGESDMKNYYEMISQLQERQLKPALEKLLPVMCMSLWGRIPDDMEIVFEPLGTTTPSERATIMGQFSSPIIQAYTSGVITQRMALLELRETGKPINAWTNITDEDIDKASDEFDAGEAGGMPGMEGMLPEGMPPEGMPPEGAESMPPEEMPQGVPTEEMPPEGVPMEEIPQEEVPPEMAEQDDSPEVPEDLKQAVLEAVEAGDIERAKEIILAYRDEKRIGQDGPEMNPAMVDPDFQENEHPRGPGGQFVSKGGGGAAPAVSPGQAQRISQTFNYQQGSVLATPRRGNGPTSLYNSTGKVASIYNAPRNKYAVQNVSMPANARVAASARRVAGNVNPAYRTQRTASQNRHINKMRSQISKMAEAGNFEGIRNALNENRHYWEDPNKMKDQGETTRKGVRRYLHDLFH